MKKMIKLLTIICVGVLLAQCSDDEGKLSGSGNITKEDRTIGAFQEIQINGILNIFLLPGDNYEVQVETDDNLQQIIEVEQRSSVLEVKSLSSQDFTNATKMNVYITAPSFTRIVTNGITNLSTLNSFNLRTLDVENHSTGNFQFEGEIGTLWLTTDDIGNTILVGKADKVIIDNSSIGNLNSFGMKSREMEIDHSGTGTVEIFVVEKLTLNHNGIGDVYCKGNPGDVIKSLSGIGGLIFIGN